MQSTLETEMRRSTGYNKQVVKSHVQSAAKTFLRWEAEDKHTWRKSHEHRWKEKWRHVKMQEAAPRGLDMIS